MLSVLQNIFPRTTPISGTKDTSPDSKPARVEYFDQSNDQAQVYPGKSTLYKPVPPVQLMSDQVDLIKQILDALNGPREVKESLAVPLLLSFAKHVHLVPASEAHHHSRPGGLWRHSLEVAASATQTATTSVGWLSIGSQLDDSSLRGLYTERAAFATFMAALLHDAG